MRLEQGVWGVGLALFVGCGAAPTPPVAPPPPAPAAPVASAAAPVASAAPVADDNDDPDESDKPIVLAPEFAPPIDATKFPAKGGDEEKCWQTVAITGDSAKDFTALTSSCGQPMGLMEYVQPAHGHLHSVKDKRDTFQTKLYKGVCYRYFAVGDSGIKDIDILVEKVGNVLVGDDKQHGPIAIIDASKTWCMTENAEYMFNVEVHGDGVGKYMFGIYARPK